MAEWVTGTGIVGLFATAALLIWRLVRLGVNAETRLLNPAYERITQLEERIGALEKAQRDCEQIRARALYLLRVNGISTEELT